jgi:sulfane dehydrogenase subunit SoxC
MTIVLISQHEQDQPGDFVTELDQRPVAGNGLLDRRIFLQAGIAGGATLLTAQAAGPMSDNGAPSDHESHVKRIAIASAPGTTGAGVSRTPLEYLDGIITPSRLHFERHHSGIPDINPDEHRLVIHGMVDRTGPYRSVSMRSPDIRRYRGSSSSNAPVTAAPRSRQIPYNRAAAPFTGWLLQASGAVCPCLCCSTRLV